jgi:hypothetical protein
MADNPPPAAIPTPPEKRSFPMSVTSRILLMLVILAVGIAVVFALTLQGLRRTNQALQQLSSVEMEQLIASTRVMQQSEMIGSYARLVAITNDIGERRLNMVELTDRMGWLDKLLGEMTQSRQEGAIDPLMQSKRNALNANVQKLSQAIFQPAQHGLDDRQIARAGSDVEVVAREVDDVLRNRSEVLDLEKGHRPGEFVVFQMQIKQVGEVPEGGRNGTVQSIVAQVESDELGQAAEGGGDRAAQLVVFEQ